MPTNQVVDEVENINGKKKIYSALQQDLSQYPSTVVAGQSEVLAKIFDDPRPRLVDLDSQYWATYYLGAVAYLQRPTEYKVTVPATTPADTTYLVANGKVIKNWNTASPQDVTPTSPPPNLFSQSTSLVLSGDISINGATTGVVANAMILQPLLSNKDVPADLTSIGGIISLWQNHGFKLLATDASATTNVPTVHFDPSGLKCRDIALVVRVVSAPAADTPVSLSITGKKVQHKYEVE